MFHKGAQPEAFTLHQLLSASARDLQICKKQADHVLAVISNDLNVLIFYGSHQFWYANSIDVKALNATSFCRRTLDTSLGLTTQQLQLMSVLIGLTPYMPKQIIENWLVKHDIQVTDIIEQVASIIKQNTIDSKIDVDKIAIDLFDKHSKHDINAITNGLSYYDIRFSVKMPINDSFTEFSRNRNSFIFKLDDVFLIKDISYFDYREKRAQYFPGLVISVLQKMIGILFAKQIIKPMDRKICMKIAHDEPSRIIHIPVIYPEGS